MLELDAKLTQASHCAKYLGQKSFSLKVLARATHKHTPDLAVYAAHGNVLGNS